MRHDPGSTSAGESLVAFYGRRPPLLTQLVFAVQARLLKGLLRGRFRPRPEPQLHATIIRLVPVACSVVRSAGREQTRSNATLVREGVASSGALPFSVQFGGFDADRYYGFESKGRSPFERSFEIKNGQAVLIGWPVYRNHLGITPIGDLRAELERCGFSHKYSNSDEEFDNDMYINIGSVDSMGFSSLESSAIVNEVRDMLAADKRIVTVEAEDLSIVTYSDRTLPVDSTRATRFF